MYQGIKTVSFEEAVKVVKSGDRIHLHSVACAPQGLIQALCARGRAGELKNIKLQHLHTEGCPLCGTGIRRCIPTGILFCGT